MEMDSVWPGYFEEDGEGPFLLMLGKSGVTVVPEASQYGSKIY